MHGGTRSGAGRPKGSRTPGHHEKVKTAAIARAKGEAVIRAQNLEPFEGDAHAYIVSVYKDPTKTDAERLQAAHSAAPYEKPRLNSIDARIDQHTTHSLGEDPGDALVDAVSRRAAARTGNGGDPGPHPRTTH